MAGCALWERALAGGIHSSIPILLPQGEWQEARAASSAQDIIFGGRKRSGSGSAWIAWTQCHLVGLSPGSTMSLPPRQCGTGKRFLWGGSDDVWQAELTLRSFKILCQVSTSALRENKQTKRLQASYPPIITIFLNTFPFSCLPLALYWSSFAALHTISSLHVDLLAL